MKKRKKIVVLFKEEHHKIFRRVYASIGVVSDESFNLQTITILLCF